MIPIQDEILTGSRKMGGLDKNEINTLYRILDANSNRCAEGLRVIEEIARLGLNDPEMAGEIKSLRHEVRHSVSFLAGNSVNFRDSEGDVGKDLPSETEMARSSFGNVLRASFLRVEEGLRVMEEFSKLIRVETSRKFKRLRFRVYNLEKILLGKRARSGVMPAAPFLYAVIDRSIVDEKGVKKAARALCDGGADILQYRAKDIPSTQGLSDLAAIIFEASKKNIPVIVNDDPFLAAQAGADGVHLGGTDPDPSTAREILGPDAIVGLTVYSLEQLEDLTAELADYIGVGAVFPTGTKSDVEVVGPAFIQAASQRTKLPLVAIGGITPMNAASVFEHGADGIAVISALLNGDIKKNCFTFRQIIDKR